MKCHPQVIHLSKNIFDDFLQQSLFINEDLLKHTYIPNDLPRREKQIKDVQFQLLPALRLKAPGNFLIYGKTGTGKTVVIMLVFKQLKEKAKQLGIISRVHTLYINCQRAVTETQIIREISSTYSKDRIPPSQGWGIKDHYDFLIKTLENTGGIFIVVLDEIDKIREPSVLYNLTRIRPKKASLSIIGISNDLHFLDALDPRIKSSLGEDQLVFPPYTADDLVVILTQRVNGAIKENVLDDGVIALCAALAGSEHGDARKALDMLRIAIKLAEYDGVQKVTEKYVYKAQQKLEHDKYIETIRTLPLQAKLVLLSIVMQTQKKQSNEKLTTGIVYSTYCKLCHKIGWGANILTQRRVTDILAELDMLGLINARTTSYGRWGRTKEIILTAPDELIYKSIESEEILFAHPKEKNLSEYKIFTSI
jgi:cell division control protein 6